MNERVDFTKGYEMQKDLDELIAKRHSVTYETTHNKRLLALLVEISELANETRTFKYWSLRKGILKERVLDEYADCLHFFLSIGIELKSSRKIFEVVKQDDDLSTQLLNLYSLVIKLYDDFTIDHYVRAFQQFVNLIPALETSAEIVKFAYHKKLDENFRRQEENY